VPRRTAKPGDDPGVIGYWAAYHGLTWDDVVNDDDLCDHVAGPDNREEFDRGVEQFLDERQTERLRDLKKTLETL
jgi:hypothetical protein